MPYAQYRTQDRIKHNSIVQRIVKHDFSKTFWVHLFFRPGNVKFNDFSLPFEPWMWRLGAGRVRLSNSDKNIGAGGWRMDQLFEAKDSGVVLAHQRTHTHYNIIKYTIILYITFKILNIYS